MVINKFKKINPALSRGVFPPKAGAPLEQNPAGRLSATIHPRSPAIGGTGYFGRCRINIPSLPGCYQFYDAKGKLLYIDLGAMIQGGMGIAAGGNINPDPGGVSMFEPIGGSSPKYAGKNIINPLAAICAGAMMLKHLGEEGAGDIIEAAVIKATGKGHIKSLAAGQMGMSTSTVGDLIAGFVS